MVAALLTTTTTTTHHPITHSKARVSIRCRFKKLTFCCCSFYPRLCKYRTMKHVWYSIVQSRIYLCVCIINLYSRGCYIISHLWIDTKQEYRLNQITIQILAGIYCIYLFIHPAPSLSLSLSWLYLFNTFNQPILFILSYFFITFSGS